MPAQHNLKNIRRLLTEGFSPDDLRYFAHDTPHFKAVYNDLAQSTGKAEIAHRLLEYANYQGLLDELLAWAKEENALGFEKYQPYYETAVSKIDLGALKTLLAQAEAHRAAGEWKEAARDAGEALKLDHRNARALVIRAEAYLGLDRWDDAIRDTTEALGIEPRNVRAWCIRAGAYLNLGDRWDDVIRDATEALGIEPQNLRALTIRAFAYQRQNLPRRDDAIRDATEALEITAQNDEDLTYSAVCMGIRVLAHYGLGPKYEAKPDAEEFVKMEIKPNTTFKSRRLELLRELVLNKLENSRRAAELHSEEMSRVRLGDVGSSRGEGYRTRKNAE